MFSVSFQSTVATYFGEIQSRASQNFEATKEHVVPYVQQASDTATKKLGDLSTMLETQVDDLRMQLESTAQELRTSLEGNFEKLTELLAPYATKLQEHFGSIVEKVKESTTA